MISTILPTYARADLEFVKGQGAWLTEADGSHFLDLASGIAVNSLGHAHPDLVKIIKSQQKGFGTYQTFMKYLSNVP